MNQNILSSFYWFVGFFNFGIGIALTDDTDPIFMKILSIIVITAGALILAYKFQELKTILEKRS